jgi:hypothetical protein
MSRLFKAIAIRRFFANRKDRVVANKAKTNAHATLHARAATAFYWLSGSLRGLLCAEQTARQTDWSTQPCGSWISGMQPCTSVRRMSPRAVVVA